MQQIKFIAMLLLVVSSNQLLKAQCTDETNVYTFSIGSTKYEVVKDAKTWRDAAQCAVERGGYLAEINNETEQNSIFKELKNRAEINISKTRAPDGGGGAYVWLGGNDLGGEGAWYWDGDNNNKGTLFWIGDANGAAQNDAYTNWGFEPDNYNEQDALGISLNGWPLGTEGQWNDVDHENELYFIVEIDNAASINKTRATYKCSVFPNPVNHVLTLDFTENTFKKCDISNALGVQILQFTINANISQKKIDLNALANGVYFVTLYSTKGTVTHRIYKN
ncbi:MAG: T9SS type A sorting domain-containing protein [Bacteroidia bacterium]